MKNGMPGRHRNWRPVDFRLEQVPWPKDICAVCPNCSCRIAFEAKKAYEYQGPVYKQGIPRKLEGHGVCAECVHVFKEIAWPESAYFQFRLKEGTVWAWNNEFVKVLRARLQPIRPTDAEYLEIHELALHFLARLPKFALIKKNRAVLLKEMANA